MSAKHRDESRREMRTVSRLLMLTCLLGSGCSTTPGDLTTASTISNYKEANVFSPAGYSISSGPNGSLHVKAAGPPGTPSDRLEKIALARAAEYGNERHLKAFTATPPQTSFVCGKTSYYSKGEKTNVKPIDLRVVDLDVTYDPNTSDPQARPTRGTAEALKAELAADVVPPDVQALSAQEVAQQCGR